MVISEWNDMIRKEMNTLVHDKGINSFVINIQKDEQLFEVNLLFKNFDCYIFPHISFLNFKCEIRNDFKLKN